MNRTTQQNRAYHKYFDLLAKALNDAGYTREVMYEKTGGKIDMSWSASGIKDVLWRPVMQAMTGKESTREMTTGEVNRVYEQLDARISELTGVHVPFPNDGQEEL